MGGCGRRIARFWPLACSANLHSRTFDRRPHAEERPVGSRWQPRSQAALIQERVVAIVPDLEVVDRNPEDIALNQSAVDAVLTELADVPPAVRPETDRVGNRVRIGARPSLGVQAGIPAATGRWHEVEPSAVADLLFADGAGVGTSVAPADLRHSRAADGDVDSCRPRERP